MANDGFVCKNIWVTAALVYAGYEVYRVEILSRTETEWYLDAPAEDAKLILNDYENNQLMLSDAKAYSIVFMQLSKQQRDLRRNGHLSWCSTAWQRGDVG